MKVFHKSVIILLLFAMLLGLNGCAFLGKERTEEEDRARLTEILNDLAENYHPATAGNTLTAARITADLLTWAATTKMDKKEAVQVVAEWLKVQSPEIKAAFQQKMDSIAGTYSQVLKDGAAGLMDSAGVEKDFSNLGTRLKEIVEAILASGGLD